MEITKKDIGSGLLAIAGMGMITASLCGAPIELAYTGIAMMLAGTGYPCVSHCFIKRDTEHDTPLSSAQLAFLAHENAATAVELTEESGLAP